MAGDSAAPPTDITTLSITGPALSSLLLLSSSHPSDIAGLLLGHLSLLPPTSPSDVDAPTSSSSSSSTFSATISSHLAIPLLADPIGRLLPVPPIDTPLTILGHFSSRRASPLRPSMRELAVSLSLAQSNLSPCISSIFLLLSPSTSSNRSIHSHDFRAFLLRHTPTPSLEPVSLSVLNLGPSFREQYSAFAPESPGIPRMPCRAGSNSTMRPDSLIYKKHTMAEQRVLDEATDGFTVEKLQRLVEAPAMYTTEIEDLYEKTLAKLKTLVRQVGESSAKVLEQETKNMSLRSKFAGLQ